MNAAGELGEMNERRKGIMKETKRSRFGVGFCRFSSFFESVLAAEFGRIHWPGRGLRNFGVERSPANFSLRRQWH